MGKNLALTPAEATFGAYEFTIESGHTARVTVEIHSPSQLFRLEGVYNEVLQLGTNWPNKYEYYIESKGFLGHLIRFYQVASNKVEALSELFKSQHFILNDNIKRISVKFRGKNDHKNFDDAVITVELAD